MGKVISFGFKNHNSVCRKQCVFTCCGIVDSAIASSESFLEITDYLRGALPLNSGVAVIEQSALFSLASSTMNSGFSWVYGVHISLPLSLPLGLPYFAKFVQYSTIFRLSSLSPAVKGLQLCLNELNTYHKSEEWNAPLSSPGSCLANK